jgi:hypothetical protein
VHVPHRFVPTGRQSRTRCNSDRVPIERLNGLAMKPVSKERLGYFRFEKVPQRQRRVQLTPRNPESGRLRASMLPSDACRRVVGFLQVNQFRQGVRLGLIYCEALFPGNRPNVFAHVEFGRPVPWVLRRPRRSLGWSGSGKQQVGQQNRHSDKGANLRTPWNIYT